MRPLVSLVEARPETIHDDYRRVLALAGLDRQPAVGHWALAATLDGAGWQPGRTCPCWQVEGVLAVAGSASGGITAAAVGPGGLQPWPTSAPWDRLRGGERLVDAVTARGAPVPLRARERLGSLEATGAAAAVPFALRHQPLLVLAAADLVSSWQLEGACAALGRLLLGGHPARRGVPAPEVQAETLALAREAFPALGAVVDGTVWHIGPRGRAASRHVLIAGDDPLAVDAIALRLAGFTFRDVPWLRLCAERGLGKVDPADMRLAGQPDLLALDFALPEPNVARRLPAGPLGRLAGRLGARRAGAAAAGGAWARLHADLLAGDR